MKYMQSFISAAICAVLLTVASSASAQTTKPGIATVVRIQGQARYSSDGQTWQALIPGKTLGAGDVVQSGVDSTVDIVFGDHAVLPQVSSHLAPPAVDLSGGRPASGMGSVQAAAEQNVIRLQSDTVLAIDKLTVSDTGVDAVSDTELDLRKGKIFGNVKKLSAASQYLIKMPTGVAGIRGTTFALGADGSVTVIAGSVVISQVGANGKVFTAVLGPGDAFNPQSDQIVHLTPQEITQYVSQGPPIITVSGPVSFQTPQGITYISPTQGAQ